MVNLCVIVLSDGPVDVRSYDFCSKRCAFLVVDLGSS